MEENELALESGLWTDELPMLTWSQKTRSFFRRLWTKGKERVQREEPQNIFLGVFIGAMILTVIITGIVLAFKK